MITAIRFNSSYKPISYQAKNKPEISFCARPEYDILTRYSSHPRYSFHFRFSEELNAVLKSVEDTYKLEKQPKFLIIGIGQGQELHSVIAGIKSIFPNKELRKVVNIDCVDLQPELPKEEFIKQNYITREIGFLPENIKETFYRSYDNPSYIQYKFKQDIIDCAYDTLYNGKNTKWDTKAEDFVTDCAPAKYNIVFMNNVLMYMEDTLEKRNIIKNIDKILKPNGFIITDAVEDYGMQKNIDFWEQYIGPHLKENFKKISTQIWQRNS